MRSMIRSHLGHRPLAVVGLLLLRLRLMGLLPVSPPLLLLPLLLLLLLLPGRLRIEYFPVCVWSTIRITSHTHEIEFDRSSPVGSSSSSLSRTWIATTSAPDARCTVVAAAVVVVVVVQ